MVAQRSRPRKAQAMRSPEASRAPAPAVYASPLAVDRRSGAGHAALSAFLSLAIMLIPRLSNPIYKLNAKGSLKFCNNSGR